MLAVFAALLTLYLSTIIPTVVDEDSGELVSAAHVLGITHPTGYPLWTMLARGFDLLPLGGTSAYRVALLSAVSAAGAGALICWLAISLTGLPLAGIFAGLAFGLWFPSWSQAVLAEVYTFEGLWFALFLAALLRWGRDGSTRSVYWVALASGFASMHHRTGLLAVGPALASALWLTRPRRAGVWAWAAGAFLAPFRDLSWNYWAYGDIETCFEAGIVSGYPDGAYHPEAAVTRDQMAVYVSRAMAGGDAAVPAGPSTATFPDVPVGSWAFRYVEYAAANDVVQGYADRSYQPALPIDRGTMAVYVARAIAGGDSAVPDSGCTAPVFPDVPCDFWSRKYIQYIEQAGVTSGYPDGNYHPEYVVTRDQMAVYIAREF